MKDHALLLDLARGETIVERGFDGAIRADDRRVSVDARFVGAGGRVFWVSGRCYTSLGVDAVRAWIDAYAPEDVGAWARAIDGDLFVIIHDPAERSATIVSDRNGTRRVHYVADEGRFAVASSPEELLPLMARPRLSAFAAFTKLATYYTLDPYSPIEGARVTMPGEVVTATVKGASSKRYHVPVADAPSYFASERAAVQGLDQAFRAVFAKRVSDRTPLVLLSGGIDSVAMTRYLSDAAPDRLRTLTFAVEGQRETELAPARVCAEHFGTRHTELIIDPSRMGGLFVQALRERASPNVSSLLNLAVRSAIEPERTALDVFTGEDTRLHTPDLDLARKAGVRLNLARRPVPAPLRRAGAALLRAWPAYPREYLASWARQIEPYPTTADYLMTGLNRAAAPPGVDLRASPGYARLAREAPALEVGMSIQDAFRRHVALAYRLQYTDNMVESWRSLTGPWTELHAPFYDHDAVDACGRVPFALGARGVVTLRSWSRFLVVNKRVLRKALAPAVPPRILYRRKATASALDVLLEPGLIGILRGILRERGDALAEALEPDAAAMARAYARAFLEASARPNASPDQRATYAAIDLAQLALLHARCVEPTFDAAEDARRYAQGASA